MKKILVTGGAGFLGSHFVDLCLNFGIEVINYDAMYIGSMEEYGPLRKHELYSFYKVDIANDEYILPTDIDAIVHFAAQTHVDRSIKTPFDFIESNILGTYKLLQQAILNKKLRFHLVSTDEVYGDTLNKTASTELSPTFSSSPYSASKSAAEQLVMAWGRTYGLDYTITRGCNTLGGRQFKEKLLPNFVELAKKGNPLPIYGDGSAIRSYIYVSDHIKAIFRVLISSDSQEIYNVAADSLFSINDIVLFLKKTYPHIITYQENRLGHDLKYDIDSTKILSNISWTPSYFGEEILKKALSEL